MIQAEWDACADPQVMLNFLRPLGKLTDRKARLFAVACCRRIWDLLTDERSREVVNVAERYADGLAGRGELDAAARAAWAAARESIRGCAVQREGWEIEVLTSGPGGLAPWVAGDMYMLGSPAFPASHAMSAVSQASPSSEGQSQTADLIRDIFGPLPFREVCIAPSVLAWDGGAVIRMAAAIYEQRLPPGGTLDNAHLAILADALEEAGCHNEEILGHGRSRSDHVRGCWLLDLLLGRE